MNINLPPALLFTGSTTLLEESATDFLQKKLCKNNGCGTCTACMQIREHTHYSCSWVEPEKRYTLDTIEIIFKKTTFALDDNQLHFFIIKKADFLNAACANSMLKIVEEPPPGYHFIFLAQRLSQVLPTIRSRCVHKTVGREAGTEELPAILQHFMKLDSDPLTFTKELSKVTMTEQECLLYLDELISYWITVYKRALKDQNKKLQDNALHMIDHFKQFLTIPPAPGGTKIFWKNVFLQKQTISL
jgi:DNA polymerase III delta prime subunit